MKTCKWFVLGLAILFFAATSEALFQGELPLKSMVQDSQFVVMAKVTKFSPETPGMSLRLEEDLKGKLPFRQLNINLVGDKEAVKLGHTPILVKRLAAEMPLLLFITKVKDTDRYACLVYTNGTWFKLNGSKPVEGATAAVWKLTHGNPYLRKAFKGSTTELRKLVNDYLTDDAPLPDFNPKEEPGFGAEVKP